MSLNRAGVKAWRRCRFGVVGADRRGVRPFTELQNLDLVEVSWNTTPKRVRALYTKGLRSPIGFPSSAGSGKAGVNLRGPPRKAKY
jgi:hypothetical protein